MIQKVFCIRIIIIHFILNAIIEKENFMVDLFIIRFFMVLKLKNIIIKDKKKVYGNILQQKVINILEILPVKNNL